MALIALQLLSVSRPGTVRAIVRKHMGQHFTEETVYAQLKSLAR